MQQLRLPLPKKRKHAGGRPTRRARPSERHKIREAFKPNEPVHVTCRAVAQAGALRTRDKYKAIRAAILTTFAREDFRIIHFSIQKTHLHLIIEAQHRIALARGMQGFQISAAKHVNGAITRRTGQRRKGSVFADRYHAEVIRSRRQARHALAYVLNNWRRHQEDRGASRMTIDAYSSAVSFEGWREDGWVNDTLDPVPVWEPRTWLLTEGWKRYGLIGTDEVPGPKPRGRAAAR